jgi:2,4-dienoyl-CoA reductase (NADPH2)
VPGLVDPLEVAGHLAPSRVVFGPHVTNLGRGRGFSERHVAYYRDRAAGGAGVVVLETASVHESDWPYERAPLAAECRPGWTAVADACRPHATVVLAGLGHRGGQGSSAYSQAALWAPSAVADALNREVPMVMEEDHVAELVDGFRAATTVAMASGLAGVEVDAGPISLLRQFHSGLTNQRADAYGTDRLRVTREVLQAVRGALGDGVLALRLSCDELAPWAGVTPEQALVQVDELAELVDVVVVVRGGPFSRSAYRPDAHTASGFNRELCAAVRRQVAGRAMVVLQGSVVDGAEADAALVSGVADAVEMTRAQIADPRLVARVRAGQDRRVRPCILCNQACQVDDVRNPLVSCVGEPRSGHETEGEDADADIDDDAGRDERRAPSFPWPSALVVGGGVAGLECARVLAAHGARVQLVERSDRLGGACARAAVGPGRERLARLTEWLAEECGRLGVDVELGREMVPEDCDAAEREGQLVVLATGGRAGSSTVARGVGAVVDAADLLAGEAEALLPADGPVLVDDPVGGPVGVGVAELLAAAGRTVDLVTPDPVAGSQLARTGDLADANVRLERAGVGRRRWTRLVATGEGMATVEDVWTGARHDVPCAVVVDCGHRLPEDALARARPHLPRAGDCVAPRSVLEAVLEGRRRALDALGREGAHPHGVAVGAAAP